MTVAAAVRIKPMTVEPYSASFVYFCRWLRRRSLPLPGRENFAINIPGEWRVLRKDVLLSAIRVEADKTNAILCAAERLVRVEYEERLVPASELGTLPLWFV